jgi:hypothetical protein
MIGAKEAGKSHYIAVLIEEMRRNIGPNMDILLTPMNEDTNKRYQEDFHKPVYNDKKVIKTTDSAFVDRKVRQPLLYSIIVSEKSWFGGNDRIKKAFVLVFFDTAGENLNDGDVMSTVNKYIYRSDGLILLMDPLQLSTVRSQLPDETALPEINTEIYDILNRTTRLIEQGRHLKHIDKIKTPLAIAFSKFDAVLPIVDEQFQLHKSANHENGFDMEDFDAINSEMMSLLDQWGGQDIIQMAKTRYAKYGFFGLSALGCNPHDTNKIPSVVPRRVEDPFLWLLAQNRTIPVNIAEKINPNWLLSLWGNLKKGWNYYLDMNPVLKLAIPVVLVSVLIWFFWPKTACTLDGYIQMAQVDKGTYLLTKYPNTAPFLAAIGKNKVIIEKDFMIQTGEVTVGEFRRFVKSGFLSKTELKRLGRDWEKDKDENLYGDNYPVSNVNWKFADKYVQWLSKKTTCSFKLPTANQWAAAAMLYDANKSEQGIRLQAIDSKKKTPTFLLFNLEEWSGTPCSNGKGRYRLGHIYSAYFSRGFNKKLACGLWRTSSIGFRLVKESKLDESLTVR